MGQPLPPVGRPGPKAWGRPRWAGARDAVPAPWASVGGTLLGWSLGLGVGAAANHVGGTWAANAALGFGLAAPLLLCGAWAARRWTRAAGRRVAPGARATPRGPVHPQARPQAWERPERAGRQDRAERFGRAERHERAERPVARHSGALVVAAGRVPAAPNTPRALLLHGEAALPQATGALLQVLAQVLAPCRVGLFHHDVGGKLEMRASRTTVTPPPPGGPAAAGPTPSAAGAPSRGGQAALGGTEGSPPPSSPGGADDAGDAEGEAWPATALERLREAAAQRRAGALPVGAGPTELWAAPILEAPREPGAGHLWGLLAVLRPTPQAWSGADVALLEGVAGQLALAWGLEQALRISRRHLQRLERIATTDGLTELINQRHFAKLFDLQLARARRYGRRLSLIFLDIDHFKDVNDTHGHQAGDEVLKKVAEVLRGTARCTDTVARLGGEEFAVLMEETGTKGAERYAERIRQALGRELFVAERGAFRKTCSLGIATFPEHGAQAKELMARADQALYLAKRSGRNRTVIYRADTVGRESSL